MNRSTLVMEKIMEERKNREESNNSERPVHKVKKSLKSESTTNNINSQPRNNQNVLKRDIKSDNR